MHKRSFVSLHVAVALGTLALAVACGDSSDDTSTGGSGGGTTVTVTSTTGASMTTSTTKSSTSSTSASTGASTSSTGQGGTGGGPDMAMFNITPIGTPGWEPVDYHQFSVELGAQFENFGDVMTGLLPPPDHAMHPDLGIGPGMAHAGPYDDDFAGGMAAQGYVDQHTYQQSEGLLPFGIMSVFMVVPSAGAPMGSSPDSSSGPIIPNEVFPIVVTAGAYQDNVALDGYAYSFPVGPLDDTLDPPFDVDGHSHFPMFDAIYFDGMTELPGTIETRIEMLDANGEGWLISYTSIAE